MLELLTLLVSCSPPPPGFYDVRPPSGSRIPSNAQLVLLAYDVFAEPQITISQLDVIYSITPTIENGVVLVDISGLNLSGEITLFATADDPRAMDLTATFTVVPEEDVTPPTFAGIHQLTYEWYEDQPGLCTAGGFHVRAHITNAPDDWGTTYYQLYELLPNDGRRWVGNTFQSGAESLSIFGYAGTTEGTRCYLAVAHDVAGHTAGDAPPAALCVDLQLPQADAGVIDSGSVDGNVGTDSGPFDTGSVDTGLKDAGAKLDTGGGGLLVEEEEGCGCTAAAPPGGSSAALVLLLLGLTGWRRVRTR